MNRFLRNTVAACAIFALAAIGFCAIEAASLANDARQALTATSARAQQSIVHLDATITDLDRLAQIAGGALNEARQIERDNRKEIAAVNRQTLRTLQNAAALIDAVNLTQRQAGSSIADMSAALVPVIKQTQQDLADLKPAIEQMTPLLQQGTAIAGNLNASTADVEHEIHKLVYPPPRKWYQKYFLDPLRAAAHLVTIPVR